MPECWGAGIFWSTRVQRCLLSALENYNHIALRTLSFDIDLSGCFWISDFSHFRLEISMMASWFHNIRSMPYVFLVGRSRSDWLYFPLQILSIIFRPHCWGRVHFTVVVRPFWRLWFSGPLITVSSSCWLHVLYFNNVYMRPHCPCFFVCFSAWGYILAQSITTDLFSCLLFESALY